MHTVIGGFRFLRTTSACSKGFALITVIVFIAVLMATMGIVMNATLMETIMSGAGTVSKQALSAADAGAEYVRGTFVLIGNSFSGSSSSGNYTDEVQDNLSDPLKSQITFVNLSSMGVDNSLLTGSGFSGKYVSSNSGSNSLSLSAHRSKITSTSEVNTYTKTVEYQGYSLAP